jgi:hypothetical protein
VGESDALDASHCLGSAQKSVFVVQMMSPSQRPSPGPRMTSTIFGSTIFEWRSATRSTPRARRSSNRPLALVEGRRGEALRVVVEEVVVAEEAPKPMMGRCDAVDA